MKRLSLFLIFLMLACCAQAATVILSWDAMPSGQTWTAVRIYERVGAASPYTYTQIISIPCPSCTTATFTVTPVGNHTYIARSYDGTVESADSNGVVVTVTAPPVPPGNLRMTKFSASVSYFMTTFTAQTNVPAKTSLTVKGKTYAVDARFTTVHRKSFYGRMVRGTSYLWTAIDINGNKITATGIV
jgi:hypothetical protein